MDLLVSRVDGTFNGLTGRTVIRLEDGTVWKQANAEDRYRPRVTDHPAAVVIHGVFGYKMQVEGTQEFYVDPVRTLEAAWGFGAVMPAYAPPCLFRRAESESLNARFQLFKPLRHIISVYL